MLTIRWANGREVSLREFPMAELLSAAEAAEMVRAEEVVIGVPDGRSVTVLLNATTILSDEGAVESMVVAMQDMADVEEQGRLRAEVPGHGEPRAEDAPDLHRGVGQCDHAPGRRTSTLPWSASSRASSVTRPST